MAKTTRKRVSHRKREVCRDEPLHIGIQLLPGLPSMRTPGAKLVVFEAIRAMRGRFGFRIVEFAVMSNHIHMLCEAKNNDELAAAMKSFKVRLAGGFNKLWERAGQVWADRFWSRVVRKVHELRRLVRYILLNGRRHGIQLPDDEPDWYTSGPWFPFWEGRWGQTFSKNPPPTERATYMALQCARRFLIELDDKPMPPPPLPDRRKRRRLFNVVQPAT